MHNGLVKILTGIRRSGKSYLLSVLFREYLREIGVDDSHVIEVPLDRNEFKAYRDAISLGDYVRSKLPNDGLLWLGLCAGEWTHQTFVRNKTDLNKCLIYFNGVNVKDYDDGHSSLLNSNTQPLTVGGGGNVSRIFPGSIDEVRVSTVARSADWVKASHDTVTESSFAIYGPARENVKTGIMIIIE